MQVLAEAEADAETEHGEAEHDMNRRAVEDDHTSTTSEYAFVGDGPLAEPTPVATGGPTLIAYVSSATSSSSRSGSTSGVRSPITVPGAAYQNRDPVTRFSTRRL